MEISYENARFREVFALKIIDFRVNLPNLSPWLMDQTSVWVPRVQLQLAEVGQYYLSQLMLRKSWHLSEYIQAVHRPSRQ